MENNHTTNVSYTSPKPNEDEILRYFMENDEYLEEERGRIILPVIFGIITLLGVTGNGLVIFIYVTRKQMRTLTNMLILNLAVADLLFLVICIPLTIFRFIASFWPLGDTGCKISQYFVYVSVYGSVYTLVLMAICRYLAIVHPLSSIRIRTKRNMLVAIVLKWTILLGGFFPTFFQYRVYYFTSINGERSVCENSDHVANIVRGRIFFTIYCAFGYILPLTVISAFYGLIARHVLHSKGPNISEDVKETSQVRRRRNQRVARMIFFLVATFALCYLPFHIAVLSRRYGAWDMQTIDQVNTYVTLVLVAKCISTANSCMNPFLYFFTSHAFRSAFKDILCCKKQKYHATTS